MKKGDKVVCINLFGSYKYITLGREYVISDIDRVKSFYDVNCGIYYLVLNDVGFFATYESGCFSGIRDERMKKLKKLERL